MLCRVMGMRVHLKRHGYMAIKPELVKGKGKAEVWRMPRFEVIAHPETVFPGWS